MRQIFIWGAVLALVILGACSYDETPGAIVPEVAVSTFTDSDGQEYKCVTIGNLTWRAENLRKRLDEGSFGGCYTWEESLGTIRIPGSLDENLELVKQPFIDSVRYAIESGRITIDGFEDSHIFMQPVNTLNSQINIFE